MPRLWNSDINPQLDLVLEKLFKDNGGYSKF